MQKDAQLPKQGLDRGRCTICERRFLPSSQAKTSSRVMVLNYKLPGAHLRT